MVNEVLWMLSVAETADAATVADAASHVRPEVAEAQERATAPVNPPEGVIETVEVPLAPGCAIVAVVAVRAKAWAGAGLTVSGIEVDPVMLPVAASTPLTAMV